MAKSFMQAMADLFGPKSSAPGPSKTLQEFSQELGKLSDSDRAYYAEQIRKAGGEYEDPKPRS